MQEAGVLVVHEHRVVSGAGDEALGSPLGNSRRGVEDPHLGGHTLAKQRVGDDDVINVDDAFDATGHGLRRPAPRASRRVERYDGRPERRVHGVFTLIRLLDGTGGEDFSDRQRIDLGAHTILKEGGRRTKPTDVDVLLPPPSLPVNDAKGADRGSGTDEHDIIRRGERLHLTAGDVVDAPDDLATIGRRLNDWPWRRAARRCTPLCRAAVSRHGHLTRRRLERILLVAAIGQRHDESGNGERPGDAKWRSHPRPSSPPPVSEGTATTRMRHGSPSLAVRHHSATPEAYTQPSTTPANHRQHGRRDPRPWARATHRQAEDAPTDGRHGVTDGTRSFGGTSPRISAGHAIEMPVLAPSSDRAAMSVFEASNRR